jgi:hypothetical protein
VEHEENLSLRYLAAAVDRAGFAADIVHYGGCSDAVADAVLAANPILVGISVPFQLRAGDLLGIASRLRARGYRGHITAGT